jgi:ribosome-associated protein
MMDERAVRAWLDGKAEITFCRSSGPGGQNVNKVSTKASLSAPLAAIEGLSGAERAWLRERLAGRLTADGVLVVQAQDTRSQARNRELAVERALALLQAGLRRPKPRRPTRPSRASRERRLEAKKAAGRTKRERGQPPID